MEREPIDVVSRRLFDYDRTRLPNANLARRETMTFDLNTALPMTGLSMGYPAWNLLYYSLFCLLPDDGSEVHVVETGTNAGWSTVVMAQALKDRRSPSKVHTVDLMKENIDRARINVQRSGLSEQVEFHVGDALEFLGQHLDRVPHLDFVFIDDLHEGDHVIKEFTLIHPKLTRPFSTVYFDNTLTEGVADALHTIHQQFGGNLVEFPTCSWGPPGNAVWQPKRQSRGGTA